MPKKIIIVCARCGAKRGKKDYKKKKDGELYKVCNICYAKMKKVKDNIIEDSSVISQVESVKHNVQPIDVIKQSPTPTNSPVIETPVEDLQSDVEQAVEQTCDVPRSSILIPIKLVKRNEPICKLILGH